MSEWHEQLWLDWARIELEASGPEAAMEVLATYLALHPAGEPYVPQAPKVNLLPQDIPVWV